MFAHSSLRTVAALCVLSLSLAAGCAAPTSDESTEDTAESTSEELVSRSARFETFVGQDGQHYFDLIAGNGQNVLRSEGYGSQAAAEKGIAAVTTVARSTKAFQTKQAKNGEWYFNVVAQNGEIVGTSQLYATKSNATRGASTVRALAKLAGPQPVVEPAPRRERFETFVGEDKQTYFRLRAGNGEIMLGSEGYSSKAGALHGIESVRDNGARAAAYQVFETANGEYAVRLVAGNGEIIARGESYASKSNATRAVTRLVEILANHPAAE